MHGDEDKNAQGSGQECLAIRTIMHEDQDKMHEDKDTNARE